MSLSDDELQSLDPLSATSTSLPGDELLSPDVDISDELLLEEEMLLLVSLSLSLFGASNISACHRNLAKFIYFCV